jgi:exopolysaccharide production protein ExoZ
VLTQRRNEIQWLRAVAASEVAICHSDLIVKHFSNDRIVLNPWYQPLGGVGVELFFIVSGYIMCMRAPAIGSYSSFIFSRIARIYPMYWLFTTIAVLVGAAVPAWRLGGPQENITKLVMSYLVLPMWGFPILGVGWTLEYEMIFYTLVTLVMAMGMTQGRHLAKFAILLAFLGCIGCLIGPRTDGSSLRYHILSPYMFAFGVGWLFCCLELAPRLVKMGSLAVFAAIAVVAFWGGSHWGDRLIGRILFASLVFSVFILVRRPFQYNNALNRALWLVGDASFCIYLSHWFVLSATGKLLGVLGTPAEMQWIARIMGLLMCLAVGIGFFRYLERPLNRWWRGRTINSGASATNYNPANAVPQGHSTKLEIS